MKTGLKPYFYITAFFFLMLTMTTTSQAQITTVRGSVKAAETNESLIGVNIQVKSGDTGTVTDVDGTYELEIPSPDAVLIFSYVGYQNQEVAVSGRAVVNVTLEVDEQLLNEVVVVGYGTQRKSDLTGAVSTVKGEELTRLPTASVQQSLQGKIPGVQVVTSSGRPGDGAVIRIRGIGTLNNADPLYVVDGIIITGNINDLISPNDIETISVLKDASATAIYGARGANGVILITTKKGTMGKKAVVSFSTYQATQQIVRTIPLTNAQEYATLANEVTRNETNNPNAPLPFPNPETLGEGTDWQKEIYRTAPMQNYNLSISGSSDLVNYTISGDFLNQQGIIPGSEYQRITIRANSDYKVSNNIKIGHNLAFIQIDEDAAPNVTGNAYRADPTVVALDKDGNYGNTSTRSSVGNPLGQLEFENDNQSRGNRLLGSIYADVNFLKHFVLRSSYSLNLFRGNAQSFVPAFMVTPQQMRLVNGLNLSRSENTNWLWENTLTYNQSWEDFRLDLLGGVTAQNNYSGFLSASAQDLPFNDPSLRFIPLSDLDSRTISNGASEWSMFSYLFRANTTLFEKYLLTASIRADGSSRFGRNNRFGYFPSFAFGWRITEEPFMKNQNLFSNLKFRAGWGLTGNDQLGSDYASKATISSNLFAVFGVNEDILNGATLVELSNPDLRWESTAQANVGFEIGFVNNRLLAEVDYYSRTTNDILWRVPIPGSVGLEAPPVINAAQVRNSGFDVLLTWEDRKTVGYRITITGSTVNNEVLQLSDGEEEFRAGGLGFGGELGTITSGGLPVGSFYGYQTDGVIQTQAELDALNARARELTGNPNTFWRSANTRPGDLLFRDLNGDGIIDGNDRTVLGDAIPDVVYGVSLGLDYKGIDLNIDFTGQSGNQIINSKKMARFNTPNFERSYLDRWTPENPSNSEPRVTNSGDNYLLTPRFIEDGSFLLLRNVQLSYTLPSDWTKKIRFNNLRVYISGSNLHYWTKYSGYTPEIVSSVPFDSGIDRGAYPVSRLYTVGLNASF